ncbi:hypothetical protein PI124_g16497 [Phytophthora idaei]|nr:hypothetical protein PI125_g16863 [Phytophthora idaei]KAG3140838.1 hypothetical protein PI126_g15794 [Phytophthora idaei]KAG3238546.1 hypothetical protein PI124_g16497 [Phytophthora idaei]
MEEVLFLLLLDDDEALSSDAVEDVLLLSTMQPERQIIPGLRFCLTELVDADCEMIFRFDVVAVLALYRYFALPELMVKDQRDRAHSSEALYVLLYRLSDPKRLYDMVKFFGRSTGQLSRIIKHMVLYLYDRFEGII